MADPRQLLTEYHSADAPAPAWNPWDNAPAGTRVFYPTPEFVKSQAAISCTGGTTGTFKTATNAVLNGGATWWRAGWVLMDAALLNGGAFGTYDGSGYFLRGGTSGTRLDFWLGGSYMNFATVVAGTWVFFYIYYDGANKGASVNDGAVTTQAATYTPGSGNFAIGDRGDTSIWGGGIGPIFGGDGLLTAPEVTALYNAGAGVVRADAISLLGSKLLFYFTGMERTGAAVDQVGGIQLTRAGNATIRLGPILDAVVDRAPVDLWIDRVGGLNLAQATIANQPTWEADSDGAGNPGLSGDGVGMFLADTIQQTQPTEWGFKGTLSTPGAMVGSPANSSNYFAHLSPNWRLRWLSTLEVAGADLLEHYFAVRANGASSHIRVDGTQLIAGNAGLSNPLGMTVLAAQGGALANSGYIRFLAHSPAGIWSPDYLSNLEAWMASY